MLSTLTGVQFLAPKKVMNKMIFKICRSDRSFASLIAGVSAFAALTLFSINSALAQSDAMVDRVLVIVNDDVVTQSQFNYRRKGILNDMQLAGRPVPDDLNKQLLDTMVSELLQVQEAQRRGIEIGEAELQQAMQRFAGQQQLTVPQLKQRVEASGQPFSVFVNSVKDSLTISRFSEYYARSRVVVPDYEIDAWLEANNLNQDNAEYELAQILIKGGDDKRATVEQIKDEIDRGLSFQQAVLTYSEALDAQEGGSLGWRKAEQLPSLFVEAVKDLQVGDVTPVIQSPNGFHILKLVDFRGDRQEILQSNVRHLLISADSKVAKSQAKKRAFKIRQRILDGEDFETLARIFSDDSGSAALGGSLGWVSPGEMVPAFEEAYQQLAIDELSQPIESQFGVHLIKVEERRKKNITDQIKRSRADSILRRQRAEREFGQWVRELMDGAYINYVAEPV